MKSGVLSLAVLALVAPGLASAQPRVEAFSVQQKAEADRTVAAAKEGLRETLIDYPSAQVRDAKAYYENELRAVRLCGYVNSKNDSGAYIGWTRFMALNTGVVLIEYPDKPPPQDSANFIINLVCEGLTATVDTIDYSSQLTFTP